MKRRTAIVHLIGEPSTPIEGLNLMPASQWPVAAAITLAAINSTLAIVAANNARAINAQDRE